MAKKPCVRSFKLVRFLDSHIFSYAIKKKTAIAAVLLFVILAVSSIMSMRQESPVCDEVSHHIATGYSFLKTKTFKLNSTSPPLTEEIAALPLLFLKPRLPLDHPSWNEIDRSTFGFQFLYRYNNNADQLVFWVRVPMVLLSLLCGLVVFMWARELYGEKSAILALFLYVFSPNILAYSKLAIPDIGVTSFILLASYRFWKFTKKPKPKNIISAGICLGLAEASKLNALILIPLFAIVVIYKATSSRMVRYIFGYVFIVVICYASVFGAYFGEVKPLLKDDVDVAEKIDYINKASDKLFPGNQALKEKIIDFALSRPIPLATYIMNILSGTNMVFRQHIFNIFLLGKYSRTGWWYYYPTVFLLKTPIPLLVLLLLAATFFKKARAKDSSAEVMILFFVIVYIIVILFSRLQLSVRYLLPIYPFLHIYVSRLINVKLSRQYIFNIAVAILCLWYAAESIAVCPHYLSYFNQFAGGADNGWRYLRDANIDYGQDLTALSGYLKRNNIEKVKLAYFGSADPAYYNIAYEELNSDDIKAPRKEVYAVSVNYLDRAEWMQKVKPTAKAGYSIFIYDFR